MVLALISCSSPTSTYSLETTVTIEVCDGATCFVAPVESAKVTVSLGGHDSTKSTGAQGTATFNLNSTGSVEVTVRWGRQTQHANATIDSGATSVSIRLRDGARVAS
ncbi:hypothetical protein GCM10009869_17620 [Amnibacterium kyonggiense]